MGEHKAATGKHTCSYCGNTVTNCTDPDKDHSCNICSGIVGDHNASANGHNCSYCNRVISSCVDSNKDHTCDICFVDMGAHEPAAGSHNCVYCSKELNTCADANKDHKCDTCGAETSVCGTDENKDYKCDVCGKELEKPADPKPEDPKEEDPKPEDPKDEPTVPAVSGVDRLAGNTRYDTAFQAADQLKKALGVEKFQNVIVATGEQFADALAGGYLASVKDAPILLMKDRNKEINAVKDYIKANVAPGGTVYILGGTAAVPAKMETGLDGYTVKRLGGNDRYATNLQILTEAGVAGKDIVVCTGKGFADSLSASAVGLPILLVKDSLNAAQKELLSGNTGKIYVIGGVNAVSERVAKQLAAYGTVERLAGETRYKTSVLVAETFFENPTAAVLAYGENFPDGLSGGPVAYAYGAPLILTRAGRETDASKYIASKGIKDGFVQGGTTVLPEKTVNKVFGK